MTSMSSLEQLEELGDYIPENAHHGEIYTWKDFINAANGNVEYALSLRERVEWEFPETLIQEDVKQKEVIFIKNQFLMTDGDYDLIVESPKA